jgi:uncharacterized protein YecT (DUF1311 family)
LLVCLSIAGGVQTLARAAAPDCKSPETQAALDVCAGMELRDADKELNRVHRALGKELAEASAKTAFDEAEKTWEAYRDAECKFESSGVAGGSAEHMVVAYCQAQRARTRTAVLKRILNCKEGDLTCPAIKR